MADRILEGIFYCEMKIQDVERYIQGMVTFNEGQAVMFGLQHNVKEKKHYLASKEEYEELLEYLSNVQADLLFLRQKQISFMQK